MLIHGTRFSGAQWAAYPSLLPEAEVAAPDLPGHGARVGEPFTADTALAVIDEAVRGAEPGQPVVLAGHSLGGYLSMLYAATHPGALAALALVGATAEPGGRGSWTYRAFAAALPHVGHDRMARAANRVMGWLGAPAEALPDGAGYAATPDAWRVVMEQCHPSLLDRVDCPVLLVNGQWDQMRVHVRRFASRCRDVRVVTVPRASHLLPLTHPEELAAAFRPLLPGPGPSPGVGDD